MQYYKLMYSFNFGTETEVNQEPWLCDFHKGYERCKEEERQRIDENWATCEWKGDKNESCERGENKNGNGPGAWHATGNVAPHDFRICEYHMGYERGKADATAVHWVACDYVDENGSTCELGESDDGTAYGHWFRLEDDIDRDAEWFCDGHRNMRQ